MRLAPTLGVLLLLAGAAQADEPRGCGALKWPLERELAAFDHPDRLVAPSGADAAVSERAIHVKLAPVAEAALPHQPERAAKRENARAGFLRFAPVTPGLYQVTLNRGAWIDLVQDGRVLRSVAFTGVHDCRNLRKSVRYELGATPFVVQVSDAAESEIGLMVAPAAR